ncbi:MAG TPA: hypothetical protein VF744_06240 [Beijerinckiaceae bacterium]|jgi:hypothetical protein
MLKGLRILVADPDRAAAEALCATVRALGGEPVGPVGWTWRALRFVDAERPAERLDGAIFAAVLRDGDATPLALRLVERDVAYVIRADPPAPAGIKAARLDAPVLAPTAPPDAVLRALAEEVRLRQMERAVQGAGRT